jgi:hypothetical protein
MPVQLLLQVRMLQVAAYAAAGIAIDCIPCLQPPLHHVTHDQIGVQLIQSKRLVAVRICSSTKVSTAAVGRHWLEFVVHPVQGDAALWSCHAPE